MLPKRFKLKLRKETDFFNQAERFFSNFFTIFYQKNNRQLEVVVVVPKKVANLATARNALKRQMYTALLPTLRKHQSAPYSVVIAAKPAIQQLSSKELATELRAAFSALFRA